MALKADKDLMVVAFLVSFAHSDGDGCKCMTAFTQTLKTTS